MRQMKVLLKQTEVTKLSGNREHYSERKSYTHRSWLVTLVFLVFLIWIRYFCTHVL